jgi:hypothetical protein
MEQAILDAAEADDADEIVTQQAEALLEPTWDAVRAEVGNALGARIGPDLSIVSVGEAVRAGERSVRVPLVLGDGGGNTSTLVLTIQLDPILDDA